MAQPLPDAGGRVLFLCEDPQRVAAQLGGDVLTL